MTQSPKLSELPMNKGGQSLETPRNPTPESLSRGRGKRKCVTRVSLVSEVVDHVECSWVTASKAVRTIFKAIAIALHRGEVVQILGLGRFSVKPLKGYTRYVGTFFGGGNKIYGRFEHTTKTKNRVRFVPSEDIIRTLNE